MPESHEQRLARLTGLARRVWPEHEGFHIASVDGKHDSRSNYASFAELRSSTEKPRNREYYSLIDINDLMTLSEARALDALEAALVVLADEVPQWAVALAERWIDNASKDYVQREGDDACFEECAHELLAAAKAGAR